MKREPVSTRTRFEVLKRDGFKCFYCGAVAAEAQLHVDHVIPVKLGGTSDAANLVAACQKCNSGKSAVSLNECRLARQRSAEAMRAHADRISAYLGAQRSILEAQASLVDMVLDDWCDAFEVESMPMQVYRTLPFWIKTLGIRAVRGAVRLTAMNAEGGETARCKYFVSRLSRRRDALALHPELRDWYSPQPEDPPWDGWSRADFDCDHTLQPSAEAG